MLIDNLYEFLEPTVLETALKYIFQFQKSSLS